MDPVLDENDAPIPVSYRSAVLAISDSLLAELVWLNALVVGLSTDEQDRVRALPFVRLVVPCSSVSYRLSGMRSCEPPEPGRSWDQVRMAGATLLHDAGVFGTGVRVGMIDNGFRWRDMSSLADLRVENELDLIQLDSITANEPGDPGSQDGHGSSILSIIAGWTPDSLVGIAPFGTYLLAKSEDMRYELRIEEDLYVEALTWLEREGADVTSSSLGYRFFDSTDASTEYADLDGRTTFPSRAINLASVRGVTCVTAAGNYGPWTRSLVTPGDADSAITVGAMTWLGGWWAQSSWGPSASGRQKPEFTAMGAGTVSQDRWGSFITSSGTSNATPIVAGQMALLRELYPQAKPWELREAARRASQNPETPDSTSGYGTFDVGEAARSLGPGVGPPASVIVGGERTLVFCVFSPSPPSVKVRLRDPQTGAESVFNAVNVSADWYTCTIPASAFTKDVMDARIIAELGSTRTGSYPRDTAWWSLSRVDIVIPCGMRIPSIISSVESVDDDADGPIVADHPLPSGTRSFSIIGLRSVPLAVRIVRVGTGTTYPCTFAMTTVGQVTVTPPMDLPVGAWIVVLDQPDGMISIPLLQR
jgi:hypothetical protein